MNITNVRESIVKLNCLIRCVLANISTFNLSLLLNSLALIALFITYGMQ